MNYSPPLINQNEKGCALKEINAQPFFYAETIPKQIKMCYTKTNSFFLNIFKGRNGSYGTKQSEICSFTKIQNYAFI